MKKILLSSALVLVLLLTAIMASSCASSATLQSKVVPSSGTAYVVTDASTTDDPEGLRDKNFSTQDFINIWYQWDVTGTEKVISVGLVKFDLSSLKGKDIKSATLQMNATGLTVAQPIRLVDINVVDGTWDPATVTFNNKPTWSAGTIATAAVYGSGVWYSWDVSPSVTQKIADGEVSYAIGLDTMADKTQEQVLFGSQNVSATAPRLIVTYAASNTALFPMWVWIVGIVVIAIIAFFAGLMITRRNARKKASGNEPPPVQNEPPAA